MTTSAKILFTSLSARYSSMLSLCLFFCLIPALSACIGPGKASSVMENYVLEYPSPRLAELPPLDGMVKVEHFSVAKPFNSTSMVYRPEPYKMDMYASHRWIANPGHMISDLLFRDMSNSGLFRAVFSFRDIEDTRFVFEGNIDEFMEVDEGEKSSAEISITATLLDRYQASLPDRVVFQKKYHASEPIRERSADGLVRAMSIGMEKISSRMIRDVYDALHGSKK